MGLIFGASIDAIWHRDKHRYGGKLSSPKPNDRIVESIRLTFLSPRFAFSPFVPWYPAPAFRWFCWANVGKYAIHGAYSMGYDYDPIWSGWWFEILWTIWKSVGMMTFPTEWKNKTCSKPPTSDWVYWFIDNIFMLHYIYIYTHIYWFIWI